MICIRKHRGFSLIELLIVVAIILIIAAIAIPNLMRARMSANDSSAAASIHAIDVAEISYFATFATVGFPATLVPLGGAMPCTTGVATACLIDDNLAQNGGGNGKSGYSFAVAVSGAGNVQYDATAVPLVVNQTGNRSFCAVEDAVVRTKADGSDPGAHDVCMGLNPLNQ